MLKVALSVLLLSLNVSTIISLDDGLLLTQVHIL